MTPRYMTRRETAEYLRMKPDTIYYTVRQNQIPYVKLGGSIRVPRVALDRWIGQVSGGDVEKCPCCGAPIINESKR